MPHRAGIFDPWRQEEQVPQQPQRRSAQETDISTADADAVIVVRFTGRRAGITVTVPDIEDTHAQRLAAEYKLGQLVHLLYAKKEAATIFNSWGITLGQRENDVILQGLPVLVADKLSLALREITLQDSSARAVMDKCNITLFVK